MSLSLSWGERVSGRRVPSWMERHFSYLAASMQTMHSISVLKVRVSGFGMVGGWFDWGIRGGFESLYSED